MNGAVRRWYREPMVWLLVALPLASVFATVALVRVAGGGASLDVAPEPVQRSAQVQQRDLAADRRAVDLGLLAMARVDGDVLAVPAGGLPPGAYVLDLVHPGDRARDRQLHASANDGGALAFAGFDARIAWRVRLQPAAGDWRLVGRWDPGRPGAALVLQPALGAARADGAGTTR